MTFVDGGAGTAYGTNGTGTTSGFGRAELCPGMTYANIATPGGIESRLGGYSGGPGYFNPNAFCPAPAIEPDGVTVTTQAACPTCATLFGSTGQGILLGPGQFNFDALDDQDHQNHRKDHVADPRGVLQPAEPSAVRTISILVSGTGGTVSSLPNVFVAGAGTIISTSVNPRIIQLGAKFIF